MHHDLLDRFKTLNGKPTSTLEPNGRKIVGENEDEKTLEELLADLGRAHQWDVEQSEHDNIEELLKSANLALAQGPDLETVPGEEIADTKPAPAALPSVDVSVFQPEPESVEETEHPQNKADVQKGIDQEADDVLQRLTDETRLEQKEEQEHESQKHDDKPPPYEERQASTSAFDLPATPSALPKPVSTTDTEALDAELASRFASLSLPAAPSTLPTTRASAKPKTYGNPNPGKGFTDEDIDSWCIICSAYATLSCTGCDGELYCTNCWLEGHRGPDAGMEERGHRAEMFGKGKKKGPQRKVAMGA